MRKNYLLLLFSLLSMSLLAQNSWRKKEMEIRVEYSQSTLNQKLQDLKFNGDYYNDHAILFLIPQELEQLDDLGFKYTILKNDLNLYYNDFWNQKMAAYHSYQEIVDLADSLATNYPDICMKTLFGLSIQGREVAALKISDNVGDDEPEAEILFDAGIHGDEIGGPENTIRFARYLCQQYGVDPDITDLIDNREIWLYYMVNPDGRENMSRYNAAGVDCNRDWGYMWDQWGNSPAAFSQIETRYLRECMYTNQFVVHTTFHSGIEYISCPWSYRYDAPPDLDHILQLAGIYSSVSGYANLEYGQGSSGMYLINGATKDGNYGTMGAISWSMEISENKQPPSSQLMQYYNWNVPSMLAMIEHAGYGLEGIITDSISGEPVEGAIFVNDYFPTYSDSTAGDYHKYVLAGIYDITVIANGYETKTINDIAVIDSASTVTDFQLTPIDTPSQYAYRIPSCRIPDNNGDDEGNTKGVIGPPDGIFYSIGKNGWVVVDMQEPILDQAGFDIKIWEGDLSPEGYIVYAGESIDGPWHLMGSAEGTAEFELSDTGLSQVQFIKIEDDGDGTANANDAGFDLDAVSDLEHINGVFLVLYSYTIDDSGGNGNGWIDPGETIDLTIEINNNGNVSAENTLGEISTSSPYISITQGSGSFGTLLPGESAFATFTFIADASTPPAEPVGLTLDVTANLGAYITSYDIEFFVGKFPILILDLDGNHNSGPVMESVLQNMDIGVHYNTGFPSDLRLYAVVFTCLGVYNDNTTLTGMEGQLLADYLDNGGRLYMEGGDTWSYDPQTAVHPMFGLMGLHNGFDDLEIVFGQDGGFAEGMIFNYIGDNAYIDRLQTNSYDAFEVFRNQVPNYCNSVAHDPGVYKTIGSSFEFGGLEEIQSTKEELMIAILEFFGGIITEIDDNNSIKSDEFCVVVYPNPMSTQTSISVNLIKDSKITAGIYNITGRLVKSLFEAKLSSGNYLLQWDGTNDAGQKLSEGFYFCRIHNNESMISRKIIVIQ